jgi:hypothetical protein
MVDIIGNTIMVESGGDPFARNPRSSAGGLGQFIDSTWLATVKKHRPDIAEGKTDAQILQLKFNPALSREMTAAYASDNQGYLKARGIEPNAGNTYLAHFAGPQGAAALHGNPEAPVESILSRDAIAANPFLRGKTGQDVIDWAARKGNGQPSNAASTMASSLRQRFGTKTEGGSSNAPIAGGEGTTVMAGGAGMDRLKGALSGKGYDPSQIAAYSNLTKTGQNIAGKAQNWQEALLGIGTAGVGGYLEGKEGEKKKEFDAALMGAVAGAQNPLEVGKVLMQSPDEKIRAAGLELLAKNVGQAPQSRTIDGPYGQKIQQDYIDGQWVTAGGAQTGTPSFAPQQPATQPQRPIQPAEVVQPPAERTQPSAAPTPSSPPEQTVTMAGLAQAGPSLGGVNTAAKADMLPIGGAQPAPEAPEFRIGPAVPKSPEGYVHKLAPNGAGYLYGQDGQPVFETKTEAEERAKLVISNEGDAQSRSKASQGFSNMLGELKMAPQQYGKHAFERAIGPWSASTVQTEDEKGGFWGSGLSMNSVGQGIARANAELDAAFQGGAAPTEVRDSVETKLLNLATLAKPFVRKPGEGAWTDADQANLEKIVGKASRAKTVDEYNRRVEEAERVLQKAFSVKIPKVEAAPKTANAPKTAEEDVTGWEAYRKQYLGY